jgi:hypothetical protein
MADWLEMWESYTHRVVEYRDLGDWFSPRMPSRWGSSARSRGQRAIPGLYEEAASFADDFHIEIEEIIDLSNGVTFVVVLITGHPVGSSGELQMRTGNAVSWTEAVIERETAYLDIDEARAAAERLAEERG